MLDIVTMICVGVVIVCVILTGRNLYQVGALRENRKMIKALRASMDRVPMEYKEGALCLANIQLEEMEKAGMMGITR